MFCNYKDILGKSNEGVHSIRIFNLAIIDVLFTVIAAYLISIYFSVSFFITLFLLFLLGIIFHHIFCVKTTIDKLLFN
jgi:hypothetical protein